MRRLRERGIVGMNERNFSLVQRWNPRHLYPIVDDKIRTKELCVSAGVAVPETLATVSHMGELRGLEERLASHDAFALKPARGAQGNGILVVTGRDGDDWRKPDGRAVRLDDVLYRVSEILSGLFSLAGQPDRALFEECLTVHPLLERISYGGVPDLRVIVYRGMPLMAMMRLPTRRSDGRANLHQGAIGVGVWLRDGRSRFAVSKRGYVERHPDTDESLLDLQLPDFDALLRRATRAASITGLGYVGVDMVIDAERGPVVLELNARPGLSIQLANAEGLARRVEAIDRVIAEEPDLDVAARIARARAIEEGAS
jgi:alpha-L-glutamate ligase-like protein